MEFEERAITDAEASQHPSSGVVGHPPKQSRGVKELATIALGNPDEEDADGMLQVKGITEKIRRINRSKLIKAWLHQTFELSDTTVRIAPGPLLNNRTPQWILQKPDSKAGSFPLLDANATSHCKDLATKNLRHPKIGGRQGCRRCGRQLLPDESGPECEDCTSGRRDPLEVRRMLAG